MANKQDIARVELALLDPDGAFPARLAADRALVVAWLDGLRKGFAETCEEQLQEIARLSHRLAGAAGTFGYAEVSDAALMLEEFILGRPSDQSALIWLDALRQAADRLVRTLDEGL